MIEGYEGNKKLNSSHGCRCFKDGKRLVDKKQQNIEKRSEKKGALDCHLLHHLPGEGIKKKNLQSGRRVRWGLKHNGAGKERKGQLTHILCSKKTATGRFEEKNPKTCWGKQLKKGSRGYQNWEYLPS